MEDKDTWEIYPQYRKWFNKLELSLYLGYTCGPSGYAPTESNTYIVRPTYNLSGMGAGASFMYIEAGNACKVPPGYFWCEAFSGEHISVNYTKNNGVFVQDSAWVGEKSVKNPSRFTRWRHSDRKVDLVEPFSTFVDVDNINAEFIGNNLIEIHFRSSPDPKYNEIIPVWEDNEDIIYMYLQQGYKFIDSEDDANGFLTVKRKGFLVNDTTFME